MLIGLPLHFLFLLKKSLNVFFFFRAYDNTIEGIKQRFEQTYYRIYGSIQNVLAISITGRKIKDQVNQIAHFYQGSERKNEILINIFRHND